MKRNLSLIFLFAIVFFVVNSCRKDYANEQYTSNIVIQPTKASLGATVTASVTGFVTDENNHAVNGATVTSGGITAVTDSFGYFVIRNAVLPQIAGFVTVNYPGYFTGYKTFFCTPSKSMFTRVKLIPATNVGTVSSSAGGSVTSSDGSIVTLPANGVVVESGNGAYSGTVNVAVHFIDPTNIDVVTLNMPGDLRGIDTANNIKVLNSYGMVAIQLTGSSGQLLQIAAGKQATLSFPIPAALVASAPASIPLWSFNDTTGLWKEEGFATKNGNNYVGNVPHFCYWNCDYPFADGVTFQMQLVDSALRPLANNTVEILSQTGTFTGCHGYTDTSGFICGMVPANADLALNVLAATCNQAVFTKNFASSSNNIDLGSIKILDDTKKEIIIKGTVVDCNNLPVTNSSAVIYGDGLSQVAYIQNGSFSLGILSCETMSSITIIILDSENNITSSSLSSTLSPGINNLDTISNCISVNSVQYLTISVDGGNPVEASATRIPTTIISPTIYNSMYFGSIGYFAQSYQTGDSLILIQFGFDNNTNTNKLGIFLYLKGPPTTGLHSSYDYYGNDTTEIIYQPLGGVYSIPTSFTTSITEFGNVDGYIAGNFSGVFHQKDSVLEDHTIDCSFRVQREQ